MQRRQPGPLASPDYLNSVRALREMAELLAESPGDATPGEVAAFARDVAVVLASLDTPADGISGADPVLVNTGLGQGLQDGGAAEPPPWVN